MSAGFFVDLTRRRLITAGVIRQWRPWLEEINRELRLSGIVVPGGVGMGERILRQKESWLATSTTDRPNAYNTMNRAMVFPEVVNYTTCQRSLC